MINTLLITQDDIKVFAPTAELDDARINPFILETQENNLKQVLNDAFYYDFMTKVLVTGDPKYAVYQDLLNGKTYTANSQTIDYPGIKPMLAYYSLARFARNNPVHITRFGVVSKTVQQSEQVQTGVLNGYIAEKNSVGLNYQNQVITFLLNNPTIYPLYNTGGGSLTTSRASFKMFKL